jgi:hypothetical protein
MKLALLAIIALLSIISVQAAVLDTSTLTVNPVSFTINDTATLRLTVFSGGSPANFAVSVNQLSALTNFANTTITGTTSGSGPIYTFTTTWNLVPLSQGTYQFVANVTDLETNVSTLIAANGSITGQIANTVAMSSQYPTTVFIGKSFIITVNTTNNGTINQTGLNLTIAATNSTVIPIYSAFDLLVGQTNTTVFNVTMNSPGMYTIVVSEQNQNLLATQQFPITVLDYTQLPDLEVEVISASPLTTGSTTNIVVNVTNSGIADQNATIVMTVDGTNTENRTILVPLLTVAQTTFSHTFSTNGNHEINATVLNVTGELYKINNNDTLVVTTSTPSSGSSGGGGGGGGGSTLTLNVPKNATTNTTNVTEPTKIATPPKSNQSTPDNATNVSNVSGGSSNQPVNQTQTVTPVSSPLTGNVVLDFVNKKPQVVIPAIILTVLIAAFVLFKLLPPKNEEPPIQGA